MQQIAKGVFWVLVVVAAGTLLWHGFLHKMGGTAEPGIAHYSSSSLGVAFDYPDRYTVEDHTDGDVHTLVLMPKGYVPPQGGEGPPVISIQIIPNPGNMPPKQWVESDPRSNFKQGNGKTDLAVIDGEEGVGYRYSGLYETDVAAISHNGKIYLFSSSWLSSEDNSRLDMPALLRSATFI